MTRADRRLIAAVLAAAIGSGGAATAQTVTSSPELADLQTRLGATFGGAGWRGATWGVSVVSLDTGDTLFAVDPQAPLAPASNLKLLTTAAALRILGPDYRFRTYLLSTGEVVDGVLHGDLILYGTGDPGISDRFYRRKEDVFNRLVDDLERRGIHAITGDLIGDASFFSGPLRPPGWDARDLNDHFSAAVSALSFNENVLSFQVVPGRAGQRPAVHTIPEHSGLEIVNGARTIASGSRPRVHILRDSPLDPVRVEGEILAGSRDVWRQMTVSVPAHFAVSALRAVLEQRGITLGGGLRVVHEPTRSALAGSVTAPSRGRRGARVLARHVSEPLSAYLPVINKESNNLYAELVFRALGRVREGVGSAEAAARAVHEELEEMGVDTDGVVQLDGSGLSAGNRASAATFVSVLGRLASSADWGVFWASLPEAGRRGELGRMYGTPAARNLRAKTGTIERVSALSGIVRSGDGERIAFSLLVNGTRSTSRAKRAENQAGVLLASFRRPTVPVSVRFAEAPPPPRPEPSPGPGRHRVTSGESLSAIAGRYGVTVDELVRANPRVEPNRIVAGQWLEIPQRGGSD